MNKLLNLSNQPKLSLSFDYIRAFILFIIEVTMGQVGLIKGCLGFFLNTNSNKFNKQVIWVDPSRSEPI